MADMSNMPEKEKRKYRIETIKALSYLTQVGFSVCTPILLCIWGAGLLQKKWGLGSWVMGVGILVGVASGVYSLLQFLSYLSHAPRAGDEEENGGEGKKGVKP